LVGQGARKATKSKAGRSKGKKKGEMGRGRGKKKKTTGKGLELQHGMGFEWDQVLLEERQGQTAQKRIKIGKRARDEEQ